MIRVRASFRGLALGPPGQPSGKGLLPERAHTCLHRIQSHELRPRLVGELVGQLWTVVQGKRRR